MKIAILGAGVVGVTTAYELLQDGHDVTVFDRHEEAASECSFANAGMIAPGHAYPWASPRAPMILLKSLFDRTQALRFRLKIDPQMWRWCWHFLRNCNGQSVAVNARRKVQLCRYSQKLTQRVAQVTGIEYRAIRRGLLYLYRNEQHFAAACGNKSLLTDQGLVIDELTPRQVVALDPAYESAVRHFVGALYCASDETGDAREFTVGLRRWCAERGVHFRFGATVERLSLARSRVDGIHVSGGIQHFDRVVVCLGAESSRFLRRHGVHAPVYPIKGYSLTLPLEARHKPIEIGAVDEGNLVAFAPMSSGLRVTAVAEFAGYDYSYRARDFAHVARVIRELLPEGADHEKPRYWTCLRPMTPQGTPLFGSCALPDLLVNIGQGHMGWTMACGSARITADLISGRRPAVDLEGMLLDPRAGIAASRDLKWSPRVH